MSRRGIAQPFPGGARGVPYFVLDFFSKKDIIRPFCRWPDRHRRTKYIHYRGAFFIQRIFIDTNVLLLFT